jgi:predicted alpha/beta hydrolase family esterase
MKTAIIIHGMPSKESYYNSNGDSESNCHWLPWIQHELILRDILAQTPEMPVPYNPEYNSWKEMLERFLINENTILIGHSCGGGFLLRYLSENNVKVGKVVLVAPWIDLEKRLDTGMFDFNIDHNITSKTNGITIFNSLTDGGVIHDSVNKIIGEVKDIKLKNFNDMGHFCYKDMQTDKFPELLEEVLK